MTSDSEEDLSKTLYASHKPKRKKTKSPCIHQMSQDSMKEKSHGHDDGDGKRNSKQMMTKQMTELECKDVSHKRTKSKISNRAIIPEHDQKEEKSSRSRKRRKKHETFPASKERSESDSSSDTGASKEVKLKPQQLSVKEESSENEEKDWDDPMDEDSSESDTSLDGDEESDQAEDAVRAKQRKDRDLEGKSSETAEHKSKDEGEDPESEMAAIRKELSTMPFEDLQKLKEKLGLKLYKKTMFGNPAEDKKRKFKRANKNRPMEMSSKVHAKRHRQVVQVKKQVTRDPRFDDLSGQYDETFFSQAYSFLHDVKHKEKEKLLKLHAKEKDEDKKKQLKYLINRMSQQERTAKQKALRQDREREIKKKERELVQEGKTPFYLKKSEKRKLELAEKYKELKKSGKLAKYLSKKRKKNAAKDRRNLPTSS